MKALEKIQGIMQMCKVPARKVIIIIIKIEDLTKTVFDKCSVRATENKDYQSSEENLWLKQSRK